MAGAQTNIRTFIAPPKGPGRTAPAFAKDLTLYDPIHPPSSHINLLRGPPLTDAELPELAKELPADTCEHEFCVKDKQSDLPALDARADEKSIWRLGLICKKCRLHADLRVDYSVRWEDGPCPNQNNPLHHLVHSPWREDLVRSQWRSKYIGNQDEIYTFECSSHTCSATVHVRLTLPIFTAQDVYTLTDEGLLKQRTSEAFQRWPDILEGVAHPSVFDVVFDLRKYLRNAWDSSNDGKRIGLDNKRFVVRFGPEGYPCREVLQTAGFIFKPGAGWEPPRADAEDVAPFESFQNTTLDNLEHELTVIISQLSQTQRRAAQDTTILRDATKDIAKILSCQNYDKDPKSRNMQPTRAPCYVALGVDPTASDANIVFAFRQQIETDPLRATWYLSYLSQIANVRQSEELEFELAIQHSAGRFTIEQVRRAYNYFMTTDQATDDHIIGAYKSRLSDAPRQDAEMREELRIIGEHRHSAKIKDVAKGTLETYEQALTYLNAEISTGDEYIHTLYTTKVTDDPSIEPQARKAVELIARKRKNTALLDFVKTGQMGDMDMDVGEAYRMLQIDDRTTGDDMVVACYHVAIDDNPGSVEQLGRAIKAIADSRQSDTLQQLIRGGTFKASADTPVGLRNIGNTCYLNSLLQYFFTLSELRKIVLEFDQYKQKLDDEGLGSKKVGRLEVKPRQVETAQKFVSNLASLFQEMITSPDGAITPKQELARLTLESKGAVDKVRRRSTIASGGRPSLGNIDNMPILGPLGPLNDTNGMLGEEALQTESPAVDKPANPFADPLPGLVEDQDDVGNDKANSSDDLEMIDAGDNSSDVTLVSNVSMADSNGGASGVRAQQQNILDNKENLLPSTAGEGIRRSASPDKHLHPLAEASKSDINAQAGALAPPVEVLTDGFVKPESELPKKPPPVPPRPQVKEKQEAEKEIIETYAQQQDVTEVIGHCLYQFSLAIRPLGKDEDGEQLDEIHNLFYGKQVTKIVPEDASRNKYELFSNILTRVGANPTDIYAALDGYFDVEDIEGAKRYISIVDLPPILAIQLDRVEYDTVSHRAKKNNGHVQLMETIYLDRYLDEPVDSALMERRQQTWTMKKDLARLSARMEDLQANESPNAAKILSDARLVLLALQAEFPLDEDEEPLPISDRTINTISALAAQTEKEIEETTLSTSDLRQNITSNFTDMRKHGYRLHAAFFHRGTAGFGHYWIYIFDTVKEIWRKYNDEYVTDITDINEIFASPPESEPAYKGTGIPANPYFLVYVRDDQKDHLVQAVHRNIIERPPPPPRSQVEEMPPPEDVEMRDYNSEQHPRPDPTQPDYHTLFPAVVAQKGRWDRSENAYQPRTNW